MKRRYELLLIAISLIALSLGFIQPSTASRMATVESPPPPSGPSSNLQYKDGELLVKFSKNLSASTKQAAHASIGASLIKEFAAVGWQHVRLPQGMSVAQGLASYKQNNNVVAVEPNLPLKLAAVPNDPNYGDQWGLPKISAPTAWNTTTGSSTVVLAVIDTGVNYNHPDLAANMWHNPGETPGNGIDDDNNGYVDDVYGIDPSNSDSDPMDDAGHGTECAGVLGAVGNNGTGVAGLNWSVKIMALKIFYNTTSGYISEAMAAFDYVTMMKTRGINVRATSNSWEGFGSQGLKDAIDAAGDAGVLNAFASGNNGFCTPPTPPPQICSGSDLDTAPTYPTAYDSLSIIAVGSSNQTDNISHFSNYGLKSVDIAAPGEGILTTNGDGSYGFHSGTSMSTPFVAGAAGLLAAHDPSLSVASLKATLINTVDVLPDFVGKSVSGGRLNVAEALDSPTVCTYSLGTSSQQFSANPGTGRIEVSTQSNCEFTATSNDSFITVTTPQANGYAFVGYSITANDTGIERTGTITVAGETFTVTQAAAVEPPACAELSPTTENFNTSGGSSTFEVVLSGKCEFDQTALSNDFWIVVTRVDRDLVYYDVEPNTGNSRTGTILAANKTFTVTQESGCGFTLSPTGQSFEGIGGNGFFHVVGATPDCVYNAVSNDSWLTVFFGDSGVGSGDVGYSVETNNSNVDRTGTISVGNATFTVSQGRCLYSFTPASDFISASGGSNSVNMTTQSDCAWTASSSESWLHITSTASGTGNATISYTADPNVTSQVRSGYIMVGGQNFVLTQDSRLPGKIAFTYTGDGNHEIYVMNNDGSNRTRLTNNTAYDDAATWSPDGMKILFASNRDGHINLYTMDFDGGNQTRLTTTNDSDVNPSWSPDGTKIAFQSFRDGTSQIYVMNADGTNQTRISNNSYYDYYPSWSPDGLKITFSTSRTGTLRVYAMDADGSNQAAQLTDGGTNHRPSWSPDGSRIAFMSDGGPTGLFVIAVMDLPGGFSPSGFLNPYYITDGSPGADGAPRWSPNGSKITFNSTRDGNGEIYVVGSFGGPATRLTNTSGNESNPAWQPVPQKIAFTTDRDGNSEVYLMDTNGQNQVNFTNNSAADSNPSWSPDGMKLAFVSSRSGSLSQDIWVATADGSNLANLTNAANSDVNPAWSPDGSKIAFQSFRDGTSQIYVMNSDGSNQTRLSNNSTYDYLPSWSPDGTKIVFASNRNGNMQIYVMNADGSNQTRVTNNSATDHAPSWSPDGKQIAFASDRTGTFQIYVMNPDGTGQTVYTTIGGLYPHWSPDGSKIVFSNGEIFVINTGADRSDLTNLSNNPANDYGPVWRSQ